MAAKGWQPLGTRDGNQIARIGAVSHAVSGIHAG
jgi:hypothetical protein